jgi:hypothetical protein
MSSFLWDLNQQAPTSQNLHAHLAPGLVAVNDEQLEPHK